MSFVDEARITVQAGKGGNGSSSFRREKYIPFGGPDGGDGGKGGDVRFVATKDLNTLVDFQYVRRIAADNGQPGMGKQCYGKSGKDVSVPVPIGTVVRDRESQAILGDLTHDGQVLIVARGGQGGLGNIHFKSSVNQAPRRTTPGKPGERRELELELRLLADVGLLGFPNAGKSTFIRAVSNAKPKIGAYPFTTLQPHLGVVRLSAGNSFVVADIPGLIEGAAAGVGLGHQFLRHVRRSALLLHVVDIPGDGLMEPETAFQVLEKELAQYGEGLLDKERWLVLNKIDLIEPAERESRLKAFLDTIGWTGPCYGVSGATGEGIEDLVKALAERISQRKAESLDEEETSED